MSRTLQVTTGNDPMRLAEVAGPFLRSRAAEHSVVLTNLAKSLARDGQPAAVREPASLWWWVQDGPEVVAVLMRTPPYGAYLSTGPDDAMELLARTLYPRLPDLVGIGAPGRGARAFARAWLDAGGPTAEVGMRQGLLVCASLVEPTPARGRSRLATEADLVLLRRWGAAFVREASTASTRGGPAVDHVTERVAAGLLHVWEVDGAPAAMTACTPPEADVVRVQLVYTPPALRGRGFAGACVAAVTRGELAHRGRSCMLYTDLANPTSNALYERLGYRRIGEGLDLVFVAP